VSHPPGRSIFSLSTARPQDLKRIRHFFICPNLAYLGLAPRNPGIHMRPKLAGNCHPRSSRVHRASRRDYSHRMPECLPWTRSRRNAPFPGNSRPRRCRSSAGALRSIQARRDRPVGRGIASGNGSHRGAITARRPTPTGSKGGRLPRQPSNASVACSRSFKIAATWRPIAGWFRERGARFPCAPR
jgi:hypothetical protein